MKIEIAESLMLSYFKHVKKCLIVQTNWKVSSNWDTESKGNDKLEYLYNKIIKHHEFSDIFKSELKQTIRQSEVDVIGIDSSNKVFISEIAFHENGLQYGGKIDTKNRVIKKLLRAYLTASYLFPNSSYEIIFASPKVHNTTEKIIRDYFDLLNNDFSNEKVGFRYISNEKFKEDILIPTIKASKSEADTSELFVRTIKLIDLFNMVVIDPEPQPPINRITNFIEIKGIKVPLTKNDRESTQDYVKGTLRLLLDNNLIPEEEIQRLQNKEYCTQTFSINFKLFQTDKGKCSDSKGRSRYWSNDMFGGRYYVCSQWWKEKENIYSERITEWIKHIGKLNQTA